MATEIDQDPPAPVLPEIKTETVQGGQIQDETHIDTTPQTAPVVQSEPAVQPETVKETVPQAAPVAEPAPQKTELPHVTLHWLNHSRAQRMVWLLEECKGCTYSIQVYKRGDDHFAPATLKKIHPLGKSPVIQLTGPGFPSGGQTLAESSFEAEYLCDHFAPHLVPQRWKPGMENQPGGETEQWLRYRYFVHYNEGSLMPILVMAFVFNMIKSSPQPFFVKPITKAIAGKVNKAVIGPNIEKNFTFIEEQLKTSPDGGEYLCGRELNAADILMSFPILASRALIDPAKYPRITAYGKRLEKEPGYLRAVAKIEEVTGEKYTMM